MVVGSRTHGRSTFCQQQQKVLKKCRPLNLALRVPEHFHFAYGSVQLASMLDEPQNSSMNFDPTKVKVLGKVRGKGKAERQKARPDPVLSRSALHRMSEKVGKSSLTPLIYFNLTH